MLKKSIPIFTALALLSGCQTKQEDKNAALKDGLAILKEDYGSRSEAHMAGFQLGLKLAAVKEDEIPENELVAPHEYPEAEQEWKEGIFEALISSSLMKPNSEESNQSH